MFVAQRRFIDSAVAVCVLAVLLAKSCMCVTEEDDELLEKTQLMEFYSKCSPLAAAPVL